MDLTEEEKKFVERTRKHLDTKATEFVNTEVIPLLLSANLPIADHYYIIQRVKQILDEKYAKINFKDKTILAVRKSLMKSIIREAKKRNVKKPRKPDERQERCEPVCRKIIDKLLTESLLFSDEEYLPAAIENDDQLLLRVLVNGYVDNIANWLELGVRENKRRADKVLYNDKEPEEVTWKDLDKILQ